MYFAVDAQARMYFAAGTTTQRPQTCWGEPKQASLGKYVAGFGSVTFPALAPAGRRCAMLPAGNAEVERRASHCQAFEPKRRSGVENTAERMMFLQRNAAGPGVGV